MQYIFSGQSQANTDTAHFTTTGRNNELYRKGEIRFAPLTSLVSVGVPGDTIY